MLVENLPCQRKKPWLAAGKVVPNLPFWRPGVVSCRQTPARIAGNFHVFSLQSKKDTAQKKTRVFVCHPKTSPQDKFAGFLFFVWLIFSCAGATCVSVFAVHPRPCETSTPANATWSLEYKMDYEKKIGKSLGNFKKRVGSVMPSPANGTKSLGHKFGKKLTREK